MSGENVENVFMKCATNILTKIEEGENIYSWYIDFFCYSIVFLFFFLTIPGEIDPDTLGSGIQVGGYNI